VILVVGEGHRIELEPMGHQAETQAASHLSLERLDLLGAELDDRPAGEVDEMVMMLGRRPLVARAFAAKVEAFDDAFVLQKLYGAIDGRKRNPVVERDRPAMQFDDVRVVLGLADHARDHPPWSGNA
jgi:hypothetical protein